VPAAANRPHGRQHESHAAPSLATDSAAIDMMRLTGIASGAALFVAAVEHRRSGRPVPCFHLGWWVIAAVAVLGPGFPPRA